MVQLTPLILALMQGGCLLEAATGIPVPLPKEYITPPTSSHGDSSVEPWLDYEGETVTLSGVVTAAAESPVDLDFWSADPDALGGWVMLGRKNLAAPGVWTVEAPVGAGELVIESFQDAYGDGPTLDDPYGRVTFVVGDAPVTVPEFALDEGNLLTALEQRFAGLAPFRDYDGETVTLSGTITANAKSVVVMDLRAPMDEYGDEYRLEGVVLLEAPGPWALEAPAGFGELKIQVYQDQRGDGIGPDDTYAATAIAIGEASIEGIDLELAAGEYKSDSGGATRPFEGYKGETIRLVGQVISDVQRPVQIDVRTVDDTLESGLVEEGRVVLPVPKLWTVKVPVNHGQIVIQAFQDLTDDGPSDDDPFGYLILDIEDTDQLGQDLVLEVGGKVALAKEMGHGGEFAIRACADWEGPSAPITGTLTSESADRVTLDIRVRNPEVEGGVETLCRQELDTPGAFALTVQTTSAEVIVEAFQDVDANGPSELDPYGYSEVALASTAAVVIELIVGGRENAPSGETTVEPFKDYQGAKLSLSGRVQSEFEGAVQLDIRSVDTSAESGLVEEGRLILAKPEAWAIEVPKDHGELVIQAFQDLARDGLSEDDPFGYLMLEIGGAPLSGQDILLEIGGKEAMAAAMGGGGGGGGSPKPFMDHDGEWVQLVGTVTSEQAIPVNFDFAVPDASAPGGRKRLGSLSVEGSGAYALKVPKGLGSLALEVFQDPDKDGPTDNDPYATAQVTVGDADVPLDVTLIVGARGQPSGGDPNGDGDPNGGGGGSGGGNSIASCFPDLGKKPVTISGTLKVAEGDTAGLVKLDLFKPDNKSAAGRRRLCSAQFPLGAYSFEAPRDFGALELEGCIDLDNDGPSSGDPCGYFKGNPIVIGDGNVTGVHVKLKTMSRGEGGDQDGL